MLESAIKYSEAGLKVIPVYNRDDGGVTFAANWQQYRTGQTTEQVNDLFSRSCAGIALICTDDIEAIDIDTKHDPNGNIHLRYFEAIKGNDFALSVLNKCVVQHTKSGGKHIIYRAKNRQGNTKLAKIGKEAIIETRGKGGLLFIAPTAGYKFQRGDLCGLPVLTDEERNVLISFAKSFDEPKEAVQPREYKQDEETPWDAFNAATNIRDMIEAKGWTLASDRGKWHHYTKPGGSKGHTHATVNVEQNYFYPWTTDVPYQTERGYSPYAFLTETEYNGDYSASARVLIEQGFGSRPEAKEIVIPEKKKEEQQKRVLSLIDQVEKTKFDYLAPLPKADVCLWHVRNTADGAKLFPLAGFGMIGCFTGHEKAGKSFLMSKMVSSHLASGFDVFTFRLNLRGRKALFFDTEQSRFFYAVTQRRIHDDGATKGNTDRYQAYHLRSFPAKDRMAILEHYVKNTPDVGAVFIDGFVDLTEDYNNLQESQQIVGKLMEWSDKKNMLIIGNLHLNKGDGKIRGHLGSEVKNKAEFVISSTKEEQGRYSCSNPTGRFAEFPSFEWYRKRTGEFSSESWTEFDEGFYTKFVQASGAGL